MRLSEALGLVWDVIKLDQEFPHIYLVPHSWRQLKTAGSKRVIPLIWCAYKAIKIIHKQRSKGFCLFKSYTDGTRCNGNSASAALNKWSMEYTEQGVVHSFHHSFRDRLREADVCMELIDQIGGWAASSIGQGYGSGYSLQKKYEAMPRIVLTWYLVDIKCIQISVLHGFLDKLWCPHMEVHFLTKVPLNTCRKQ